MDIFDKPTVIILVVKEWLIFFCDQEKGKDVCFFFFIFLNIIPGQYNKAISRISVHTDYNACKQMIVEHSKASTKGLAGL